jgi:Uma2 family endonuclease
MLPSIAPLPPSDPLYPESDGQPMSDNTRQFWWIYVLAGNLAALFRNRDDVFVAGNQNWYPVEGEPEVVMAPDVYAVFGRPKGHRRSYKQWDEDNLPMTVVFEVLSPKNTDAEMADKLAFYDTHGVEEYYVYDPDGNHLQGYLRSGTVLLRVRGMDQFSSPRLGIRFDLSGPELVVRFPDGRPFLTFEELEAQRQEIEHQLGATQQELGATQQELGATQQELGATQQELGATQQQLGATQQQLGATQQERDDARRQLAAVHQRTARSDELTLKVLQQQATPEEVAELQRLLQSRPAAEPPQG